MISFTDLVKSRNALIGIVGLGYVGLPLALRFVEQGFRVTGFDIDQAKVENLNNGISGIEHISNNSISSAIESGFQCTTNFERISEVDAIILCVPTPLNKYREPDLSFVIHTCEAVAPYLRPGQLISLESTTYPGTTEEEIVPRVTAGGLVAGQSIFIVYSPEREDPGNEKFSIHSIPKVVAGHTEACLEAGQALYSVVAEKVVAVSSTRAAEMTKLLENIHRAVNIGLVNEMKIVADKMDIDIYEVIDAAATKPFGFTAYYPGPGLGGHCIPIDPFYLTWKARAFGLHTRFIELAGEINKAMPEYVLNKLVRALNDRGSALKDANILVLGLAYKKNVDDIRESPSIEIMELIAENGGKVSYSDPHVPIFPKTREHRFDLQSVELSPSTLAEFDAVVISTNHDKFDYELICAHSQLIIDTRGVYRNPASNIIKS